MSHLLHVLASCDASKAEVETCARPSAQDSLAAETPRLRRLVHRLLGWPKRGSEVDDVVQEVLLAAWRHRATFRGEAAWTTWLHRIAVRKAQHHQRAAAVRRRLFGWWTMEPPEPVAMAQPHAAEAPVADERIDATQHALQQLAHRDREELVLRYLEQREIPQLATLLGCSRAAVDARLSRARLRLRAALGLGDAEDA